VSGQRDFSDLARGFDPPAATNEDAFCESKANELVAAVRDICDLHGHKRVAAALGRQSAATLTQAIKVGDAAARHHIYLRELPRLIRMDATGNLVAVVNSIISEPYTPDEIVAAMTEALHESFGGEVRKGFLSATQHRLQRNRVAKKRGAQ
jgi:hypothetical protein